MLINVVLHRIEKAALNLQAHNGQDGVQFNVSDYIDFPLFDVKISYRGVFFSVTSVS
jgi:hypothetical protein